MFCKQCGNELIGTEVYCDACGAPTQAVRSKEQIVSQRLEAASAGVRGQEDGSAYRSFEYARTVVKSDLAQVAVDCYESLGYELTDQRASAPGGQVTLSFRCSRKVSSKAQLSKIQRTMDDTLASIASMEGEKTKKATTQAIVIGVVAALVLGLGMCCTMVWTQLMIPGIVIGLAGIAGCLYAYVRYRAICVAETARLNPAIEDAYDRLATLCEEAQAVLRAE